jgi:hypothetical protein
MWHVIFKGRLEKVEFEFLIEKFADFPKVLPKIILSGDLSVEIGLSRFNS